VEDGSEQAVRAALLRIGVASAFLARFDRVVALHPLDASELRELLERPHGAIDCARRIADSVGSQLVISKAAVDAFVHAAAGDPDGGWAVARPLHRLVEDVIASPGEPRHVDDALARKYIASP